MTALRLTACGPGATIQDRGRFGYMRYGVTPAGPMDAVSHAIANLLVGREAGSAAIEISLGGLTLEAVDGPAVLAVAGGQFDARLGGTLVGPTARIVLEPGVPLMLRAGTAGTWCYVASAQPFALSPVLGSLSMHLRSRMGPFDGRPLAAGDVIPLLDVAAPPSTPLLNLPAVDLGSSPIRILLGPQDDYFTADAIADLMAEPFLLDQRSDRMAYKFVGRRIAARGGHDIVSDGIAHGAVQVPGSGEPFVLMADRQPTGGYPKIGNVITADLARVAQVRPGSSVQFTSVSRDMAVEARRERGEIIRRTLDHAASARPTGLTTEHLLGLNLVDGVTDALA
jgi:biotin-dependent carboxylase-like uncharacterized protein